MLILHLILIFLKLVRENGVISPFSCLNVLKIMMKKRRNDLNRQIYPYLKIFFFYLINKAKSFFFFYQFIRYLDAKKRENFVCLVHLTSLSFL